MLNMLDEHLQMYWNVKRGLQVLRLIFSNIIQTYPTRLLCLGWTPLFTSRKMILGPSSNVSGRFLLPFQKYLFIISTFYNVSTQLAYLKKLTFYSLFHNILRRLLNHLIYYTTGGVSWQSPLWDMTPAPKHFWERLSMLVIAIKIL